MQHRRKRAKRTESQVTRFFTFEYVKASPACFPYDVKCLQGSGLPSLETSLVTRNQLRSIDKTITRDDEPFPNGYRFLSTASGLIWICGSERGVGEKDVTGMVIMQEDGQRGWDQGRGRSGRGT